MRQIFIEVRPKTLRGRNIYGFDHHFLLDVEANGFLVYFKTPFKAEKTNELDVFSLEACPFLWWPFHYI